MQRERERGRGRRRKKKKKKRREKEERERGEWGDFEKVTLWQWWSRMNIGIGLRQIVRRKIILLATTGVKACICEMTNLPPLGVWEFEKITWISSFINY